VTQKLFRPSAAPALEICAHFENLEKRSEELEAGDLFHRDCASIFKGEKTLESIPKSRRDKLAWAIEVQKQYVPWVTGVERYVELYGEADQFLTGGTIDLDGKTEFEGARIPSLLDHKPGDYIDRSAQLTIYAIARMDESRSSLCQITAAYYNQGTVDSRVISYAEAQHRLNRLVERLQGKRGPELYNISVWCSFCAVRMREGGCPAWTAYHKELAAMKGWPAELNAALAEIKKDPEKRARFIIAKRRFDAFVDAFELEKDALKDILDGKPGFGLKKQSRGFSLVIDKDYIQTEENNESNQQAGPAFSQAEPGAT
jgi:hypothetical protein